MLQRKCACGSNTSSPSGECEDCREKKLLGIQTRLRVSEPGDEYEQEADHVANQVLRMKTLGHGSGALEAPRAPLVQRRTTSTPNTATGAAPSIIDDVLASSGEPLDRATRAYFEPRFCYDFSNVRIHSDHRAAASAQSVQALAYTVGNHVIFREDQAWRGPTGNHLLAHELAHVVQQSQTTATPTVQRVQAWPDMSGTLSSAAGSLAQLASETLGPIDRTTVMQTLEVALNSPFAAIILEHPAIAAQRASFDLIRKTPNGLEIVWDLIQNPKKYEAKIHELVDPRVAAAKKLVVDQGNRALERAGVPAQYRDQIWEVMNVGAGYLEAAFGFVLNDIILDTVLFWQLRSEHDIYETAWKDYQEGRTDPVDLLIAYLQIALNVVGRLEDLLSLVLMVGGTVTGGAAGGVGGSVAPGAGTAAGAGAGSGTGGAVGAGASELVGLALELGPAIIEGTKLYKAIQQLALSDQDEKQHEQDVGQIWSSVVALAVMGAIAFLPGLALRAGRKLATKLRESLPSIGSILSRSHLRPGTLADSLSAPSAATHAFSEAYPRLQPEIGDASMPEPVARPVATDTSLGSEEHPASAARSGPSEGPSAAKFEDLGIGSGATSPQRELVSDEPSPTPGTHHETASSGVPLDQPPRPTPPDGPPAVAEPERPVAPPARRNQTEIDAIPVTETSPLASAASPEASEPVMITPAPSQVALGEAGVAGSGDDAVMHGMGSHPMDSTLIREYPGGAKLRRGADGRLLFCYNPCFDAGSLDLPQEVIDQAIVEYMNRLEEPGELALMFSFVGDRKELDTVRELAGDLALGGDDADRAFFFFKHVLLLEDRQLNLTILWEQLKAGMPIPSPRTLDTEMALRALESKMEEEISNATEGKLVRPPTRDKIEEIRRLIAAEALAADPEKRGFLPNELENYSSKMGYSERIGKLERGKSTLQDIQNLGGGKEHTHGARGSTKSKHETGQTRKAQQEREAIEYLLSRRG